MQTLWKFSLVLTPRGPQEQEEPPHYHQKWTEKPGKREGGKSWPTYKVLLPCLLGLNASVLPFRNKQQFSCKTATVTLSFPCMRAWSLNKGPQLISCELKSAIQSHTLKRLQLCMAPHGPDRGAPCTAEVFLACDSEWHFLAHMKSTEALCSSFRLSCMEMRV